MLTHRLMQGTLSVTEGVHGAGLCLAPQCPCKHVLYLAACTGSIRLLYYLFVTSKDLISSCLQISVT